MSAIGDGHGAADAARAAQPRAARHAAPVPLIDAVDEQPPAVDAGRPGIGAGRGQGRRAGTLLDDGARAADDAVEDQGVRAIEHQGAVVGDVAGDAAGGSAIAQPQRARRDRRAAGVDIVGRQRHRPGAGQGQGAGAGDRAGEQIVEAAIVDRPAAGRQRDRARAGDRGIGQQAAAVEGQRRAGRAEVEIGRDRERSRADDRAAANGC